MTVVPQADELERRLAEGERRGAALLGEVAKIPAFVRRDFLVALSYRAAFLTDIVGVVFGAFLFYFIGRLIDPASLPSVGGSQLTYFDYAAIGVALGPFLQIALSRVASVIRQEQLAGTLESLLVTPTAPATVQFGSVVYELIYIPIRTGLVLLVLALGFGLHYKASGIPVALAAGLLVVPFIWGLGLMSAASTLTYRRGGGAVDLLVGVLTLGSSAFFPLVLFPAWLTSIARVNPLYLGISSIRTALVTGGGWGPLAGRMALLAPMSVASLVLGLVAFRLALGRERRRGTLGLY
jgi:ABC-2 type transport system permease protein